VHSGTNSEWEIPAALKKNHRCLDTLFLQPEFLVPGRTRSTPFHALLFRHRIEFKIPTFTTSHNSSQHVTSLVNKFDATASNIQPHSFSSIQPHSSLSAAKESGTNLDQIFLKSPFKTCLAACLPTPRRSESSLVVIRIVLHHKWHEFSPHFHWTERKLAAWTKIILQR